MSATIARTIDGQYMVLVGGIQWGGDRDRSGAGNATFETYAEALGAYRDCGNEDDVTCHDCGTAHTADHECEPITWSYNDVKASKS